MRRLVCLGLTALLLGPHVVQAQDKQTLYVGTYTGKVSKGIYLFEMNKDTGKLTDLGLAAETTSPSFLTLHPTKPFLYAVSEVSTFQGKKSGAVAAFRIEKDKKLTELNKQPSGGEGPCHISIDKAGKNVFVANYGGGSVEMIPVKDDGSLAEPSSFVQHVGKSVNKGRQMEPHAHSINLDAANKFAFVADLGTDLINVYKVDAASGKLTANDPPAVKVAPGAGPRHFAFHPNGKNAFVINELSLTLTSFQYDAGKGTLTEIETLSTLPKDSPKKGSTAEVVVHPSGKWVFGSNRGHNTIAVFAFDQGKAKLTHVGNYGETVNTPRNFVVDPTGNFVLVGNQGGNSITVFRLNQQSGELTRVGDPTPCPTPVCLRFSQW
jgi:6-phosphogluconolactonase